MVLLEKDFKSLLKDYDGLTLIDATDDGYSTLFCISINIDTLLFTENQYIKWEDSLNNIDVIHDKFEIYCTYDKSGYDYWNNILKESNYTYINVWVSEEFNDNDLPSLKSKLKKVIEDITF